MTKCRRCQMEISYHSVHRCPGSPDAVRAMGNKPILTVDDIITAKDRLRTGLALDGPLEDLRDRLLREEWFPE